MNILGKVFILWLPFALTITLLCGIIYAVVQQNYRQTANDPQIQMAEDTATLLDLGQPFAPSTKLIDISTSLAPFIIVFNSKGDITASEALVDATIPNPPIGVLTATKDGQENRITWQPKKGVRIAAVVVAYKNGYVLAGRNLREVEKRESALGLEIFAGWLLTIILSFFFVFVTTVIKPLGENK